MRNLVTQQLRNIVDVIHIVVDLSQLLVWNRNQLGIATGFVFLRGTSTVGGCAITCLKAVSLRSLSLHSLFLHSLLPSSLHPSHPSHPSLPLSLPPSIPQSLSH